MNVATDFRALRPEFNMRRMMMMMEGFPLFLSLFLNMYLSNAPKYAIDAHLTEEIQAMYNIIFMPAFVVQLVVHFIFNLILTSYAEIGRKGKSSGSRKPSEADGSGAGTYGSGTGGGGHHRHTGTELIF